MVPWVAHKYIRVCLKVTVQSGRAGLHGSDNKQIGALIYIHSVLVSYVAWVRR
jgi:hypothetical protein